MIEGLTTSISLNQLVRPIGGAAALGLGAMSLYMVSQKWELMLFKGVDSVTTKEGKVIDNPASNIPVVVGLFGVGMQIGVGRGLGDKKAEDETKFEQAQDWLAGKLNMTRRNRES